MLQTTDSTAVEASRSTTAAPETHLSCIVCHTLSSELVCSATDLSAQHSYLEHFHGMRLRRVSARGANARSELRDRVEFTQNYATDIRRCVSCGHVFRNEQPGAAQAAAIYARDRYGEARLEALFAAELELFRPRVARLAAMFPSERTQPFVIEIGSFVGAFLSAAGERGWRAIGIDPGREVGEFCRKKQLTVVEAAADHATIQAGCADAVVIWNTFDQLPNPYPILREARRWLRPDGIFAVRVPNGDCFRRCVRLLESLPSFAGAPLRVAMAWNNLLGFPYLNGYSFAPLHRLLSGFGFVPIATHPSVLPRLSDQGSRWWAEYEEQAVKSVWRAVLRRKPDLAPWFDAYYRCAEGTLA